MDIYIDSLFAKYYDAHPLVLIDIGAGGGIQNEWRLAQEYLKVIGFEPDRRAYEELVKQGEGTFFNVGLYKEKAVLKFHLTKRQEASSLLKPNSEFLRKFHEGDTLSVQDITEINADSLDNQLIEGKIYDSDFMKIDTQGSELFILQGATSLLRDKLFGLEIEVEFSEIYKNQPLFADVDRFLRDYGFHLFDLQPYYWKRKAGRSLGKPKGQIIFADALYFRNEDSFESALRQVADESARRAKILKAVSICILYGYFDYALEIIHSVGYHMELSERMLIEKKLQRNKSIFSTLPYFRGRGRLATIMNLLWKTLALHDNKYLAKKSLGNR